MTCWEASSYAGLAITEFRWLVHLGTSPITQSTALTPDNSFQLIAEAIRLCGVVAFGL